SSRVGGDRGVVASVDQEGPARVLYKEQRHGIPPCSASERPQQRAGQLCRPSPRRPGAHHAHLDLARLDWVKPDAHGSPPLTLASTRTVVSPFLEERASGGIRQI